MERWQGVCETKDKVQGGAGRGRKVLRWRGGKVFV